MRKNSVRKFIHAILDLLPLFVIPIFALNILHKETEPISIEVQEKVSVDFNQKIQIQNGTKTEEGITFVVNNYNITYSGNPNTTVTNLARISFNVIKDHIYYYRLNYSGVTPSGNNTTWQVYSTGVNSFWNLSTKSVHTFSNSGTQYIMFAVYPYQNLNFSLNYQLFDLTQMFGVGNEPTIQEFDELLPYIYEYTESKKMLVNKPSPTTYNDTDVGSQFVYALYKPVNDYFNFNNLFNMGAIYNWIELNLFSGTAPLPVFILWNVIVYEFFVDLIFLFYGVFMFIIDFAEKCLERPFGR